MHRARTASLILGLVFAGSVSADQSLCTEKAIAVSVSTKNAESAPELSPGNLEGTYHGEHIAPKAVQLEKKLPRVVLLIDTSTSMHMRADAALDASESILSNFPPAVEVGLAFFAVDALPVAPPTTSRATLLFQLEALRRHRESFKGKTALWSAMPETIKMLDAPALGDAIYIISDGGENASRVKLKDVERNLAGTGVRVFALLIQTGSQFVSRARSPEEDSGGVIMERIVQETGGSVLFVADTGRPFPERFALVDKNGSPTRLALDLKSQTRQILDFYRVEFDLPEPSTKPQEWKLEAVGLSKTQRSNLVLTYPSLLAPCR